MFKAVVETNLGDTPIFRRGKVRDVYDLGDHLLIIATDRISAFDHVLKDPIPGKGQLLTSFCRFWFEWSKSICPSHLVSFEVDDYPQKLHAYRDQLEGRSMLVKKADRLDVEAVVRGYIVGSGWKDYQATGTVCGIELPTGLQQAEILEQPIFTPATKEDDGHDQNISFEQLIPIIGEKRSEEIRDVSMQLYMKARAYAGSRGILLADTKFEFGIVNDELILIDEVLTPDSSRYWDKEFYQVGESPQSFDKQFVRDYLESIAWDKNPPAPGLPVEIIEKTMERYQEALKRLTA